MRLAAPIPGPHADAGQWAQAVRRRGYSAAYCPLSETADDAACRAFAEAARKADIVIAEVGAWSNPIAPDAAQRRAAIDLCQKRLALAERVEARCCVNIAGSRGPKWDGPHPDNLTDATFDLIVETVRAIIDAVKPRRTFYCLETMPWVWPDSPQSYLRLIRAIDRPAFAAHLDPVNLVVSPQLAYRNADLLRECFRLLGPHIKGCHAKDILLQEKLTVHLDECPPGTGLMDYGVFLREMDRLDPDTPLCLEHLPTQDDYAAAAEYVRRVAQREGVRLR